MNDSQRPQTEAVAAFIVEQYNKIGCHGMTLGERDMLLGLDELKKLRGKAEFPFLVANMVDEKTGKPLFETSVIEEVAGVKVGIFGVTSDQPPRRFGASTNEPPAPPWKLLDPIETAKAQVAELQKKGAVIIVALSHLDTEAQKKLADTVPGINAILGGSSARRTESAEQEGQTFIAEGFSRGKYVSIMTFNIHEGRKPPYSFVDRGRKQAVRTELSRTESRLSSMQRALDMQRKALAEGEKEKAKGGDAKPEEPKELSAAEKRRAARRAPVSSESRKRFVERYEKQITELTAQKEKLETELANTRDADANADFVRYELVAASRQVKDDPEIAAAVEKFKAAHPGVKPGH